jgi:hypothetical protein
MTEMKSLISSVLQKIIPTTQRPYVGAAKQIAFIVGTGRCGSTILAQVLNAHSNICAPPELQFIIQYGQGERLYEKYLALELPRYKAKDFVKLVSDYCPYKLEGYFDYRRHFIKLRYPQTDVRTIVREFFDHICFERKKQILCEQTPWHGQRLNTLQRIFPEMKVIHIVRDGRDVSISYAKTPWWSTNIYENIKQWEREILKIHQFGRANSGNYVAIRYEDLVLDPQKELKKSWNFWDLLLKSRCSILKIYLIISRFLKMTNSNPTTRIAIEHGIKTVKSIFQGSVYSWKRNKAVDSGLLTTLSRDTLELFGYEV